MLLLFSGGCRCSSYASELVAPGLLQLADTLISTKCSAPLHVVLAMKQQGRACSLPSQAPAAARAVVLGLQLLQEVFAVHAEARGEVLKVVQVGSTAHCVMKVAAPPYKCSRMLLARQILKSSRPDRKSHFNAGC